LNPTLLSLIQNRKLGASALLARFLVLAPQLTAAEFNETLQQLKTNFPLMAVWGFAERYFQQNDCTPETIASFTNYTRAAADQVIQRALAAIGSAQNILTLSRSSLVEHLLIKRASKLAQTVFCACSLPAAEGQALSQALINAGITASCINDWELETVMPRIDVVLLGADWITDTAIINKWGSVKLSRLAVNAGKPLYFLAEGFKGGNDYSPIPHHALQQDWSDRRGRRLVQVFEVVPRGQGEILILSDPALA